MAEEKETVEADEARPNTLGFIREEIEADLAEARDYAHKVDPVGTPRKLLTVNTNDDRSAHLQTECVFPVHLVESDRIAIDFESRLVHGDFLEFVYP